MWIMVFVSEKTRISLEQLAMQVLTLTLELVSQLTASYFCGWIYLFIYGLLHISFDLYFI